MVSSTLERPGPAGGTPPRPGRGRRVLQFLRNTWRGLTSMRTALILLFLLALASLPGALLPQWSLNQTKVRQYLTDHPTWGPIAAKLGLFEVFASPWYAAIYLSLFLSLIGCLVPRCWDFVRQLRAVPVRTPRNLGRLPLHREHTVTGESADEVAARVEQSLRRKRWRVVRRQEADGTTTVSAEKGYLREVGNLVFHFSLLGLLVAVAIGKLFGYEGSVITRVGQPFCSGSTAQYDNFRPGLTVDGTDLEPFCLDIDSFTAHYAPSGQALDFAAQLRYQDGDGALRPYTLQVNEPLRLSGGDRVYLLGHGYAPTVRITFPDGQTRDYSANFISSDPMLLSSGAIKVTDPPGASLADLSKKQIAIVGLFAPTAVVQDKIMTSGYPAPQEPGLAVDVYQGDLGLDSGRPQSVYAIDRSQVDAGRLVKDGRVNLLEGETYEMKDGTRITFTGYQQWVSIQTSYDPGQTAALISAITLLGGLMLSLTIKRRRVWYRCSPSSTVGSTRVEVGGLARTDQAGYGSEFAGIAALALPEDQRRRALEHDDDTVGTADGDSRTDGTAAGRDVAPDHPGDDPQDVEERS